MTDTAASAIGATVGVYIVSEILDSITQLGQVRYGFPTHYFDAWETMFTDNTYFAGDGGRSRRASRVSRSGARRGGHVLQPQGHSLLTLPTRVRVKRAMLSRDIGREHG